MTRTSVPTRQIGSTRLYASLRSAQLAARREASLGWGETVSVFEHSGGAFSWRIEAAPELMPGDAIRRVCYFSRIYRAWRYYQ